MAQKRDDEVPDLLGDAPVPWPEDRHDLREPGSDWTSHAMLDWQQGQCTGRMEGYHRAAQILAADLLKHRSDLDFVIFPFVACWRHHIELRLKALLIDLERLADRPPRKRGGHNVLQLWEEARPLILKLHPEENRRDPANVTRVLRQLHDLDPDGQKLSLRKAS